MFLSMIYIVLINVSMSKNIAIVFLIENQFQTESGSWNEIFEEHYRP